MTKNEQNKIFYGLHFLFECSASIVHPFNVHMLDVMSEATLVNQVQSLFQEAQYWHDVNMQNESQSPDCCQ